MRARGLLLTLCIASSASSCGLTALPPAPIHMRNRLIDYRQLRLAVLEFSAWHGEKGDHSKIIPAILASELEFGGRFSMHDAAGFQGKIDGSGDRYIDMYISGTIVAMSASYLTVELKMANSVSHDVLYSDSVNIPFAEPERRKIIKKIALTISEFVDNKKKIIGQVLGVDGKMIIVGVGKNAGVKRGMVADLHASSERLDRQKDSGLYNEIVKFSGLNQEAETLKQLPMITAPIVVGSLVIVSVEENYSIGSLYRGDYASPYDDIIFR